VETQACPRARPSASPNASAVGRVQPSTASELVRRVIEMAGAGAGVGVGGQERQQVRIRRTMMHPAHAVHASQRVHPPAPAHTRAPEAPTGRGARAHPHPSAKERARVGCVGVGVSMGVLWTPLDRRVQHPPAPAARAAPTPTPTAAAVRGGRDGRGVEVEDVVDIWERDDGRG
jgi:hypothetical protein